MMTLTPAYGRDYRTAKDALADYNAGKDFIINDITSRWDGKPVNKKQLNGDAVMLRFNDARKVTVTGGAH